MEIGDVFIFSGYGHVNTSAFTLISVGGVTVSMVAFQAVDPGSTPGRRNISFFSNKQNVIFFVFNFLIFFKLLIKMFNALIA